MKNLRTQSRVVPDPADDYADWPEPQPLQRPLPPAPKYPIKALGGVLGPAARKIAESCKVPDALAGQCVLAAWTYAAQGLWDVELHGRRSPTSGFFLTIAESGDRKSAVDRIALRQIYRHQDLLAKRYGKKLKEFQGAQDRYKREERRLHRLEDGEARARALQRLGEPPQRSTSPIIICDDPSMEGLIKHLAAGRPSAGIFSDEGGKFVGGYAMRSDNARNTAAALNLIWDGGPLTRVRANDEPLSLSGRRVSIHLMLQPAIAEHLTASPELIGQGFLSRCLATMPESLAGHRDYEAVNIYELPEVKRYEARLRKLLRRSLPIKPGTRNELDPGVLTPTKLAAKCWVKFHDAVDRASGPGGELKSIYSFAAKAPEHALRLAAVLAAVGNPACKWIRIKVMKNAIALVRYHIREALRLYGVGAGDPLLTKAELTLAWLRTRKERRIPLSLVYQCGPTPVRDAAMARSIMKTLVGHSWARLLDSEEERQGLGKEVYIVRKE
jgi:hypothetical protein